MVIERMPWFWFWFWLQCADRSRRVQSRGSAREGVAKNRIIQNSVFFTSLVDAVRPLMNRRKLRRLKRMYRLVRKNSYHKVCTLPYVGIIAFIGTIEYVLPIEDSWNGGFQWVNESMSNCPASARYVCISLYFPLFLFWSSLGYLHPASGH